MGLSPNACKLVTLLTLRQFKNTKYFLTFQSTAQIQNPCLGSQQLSSFVRSLELLIASIRPQQPDYSSSSSHHSEMSPQEFHQLTESLLNKATHPCHRAKRVIDNWWINNVGCATNHNSKAWVVLWVQLETHDERCSSKYLELHEDRELCNQLLDGAKKGSKGDIPPLQGMKVHVRRSQGQTANRKKNKQVTEVPKGDSGERGNKKARTKLAERTRNQVFRHRREYQ